MSPLTTESYDSALQDRDMIYLTPFARFVHSCWLLRLLILSHARYTALAPLFQSRAKQDMPKTRQRMARERRGA